jgi:hypothetical protein
MGLIAHWPLNGNTNDISGSGYNGSTIGTLNTTPGKIGLTYVFTNTDNGVNIDNNFVGLRQYTMTAWINPAGNHRNYEGAIISSGNWNTTQWVFGLKQDNTAIDVAGPGYLNYINYNVPLNTWTHVATTVSDGLAKLYVNGVYIGERNIGAALVSDASNTCIGRETYAGGYFAFNGLINDVRIYDHTLSLQEVKEISQAKLLHYTFDDFQEPTTNLVSSINSRFDIWGGTTGTSTNYTLANGRPGVYMTFTGSSGGGVRWAVANNGDSMVTDASKLYTVSATIKYINNPSANLFYIRQYRSDNSQISEGGVYNSSQTRYLNNG